MTVESPNESNAVVLLSIHLGEGSFQREVLVGFNIWRQIRHPTAVRCFDDVLTVFQRDAVIL